MEQRLGLTSESTQIRQEYKMAGSAHVDTFLIVYVQLYDTDTTVLVCQLLQIPSRVRHPRGRIYD